MRNLGVLLLKEERALFSSPIAYVVMTVFLLINDRPHCVGAREKAPVQN